MDIDFPEKLKIYYKRLFPFDVFYDWLEYKHENNKIASFPHREFSFTLENDVYLRFNSFPNKDLFIRRIQESTPFKIDIGGEYNDDPKLKNNNLQVIRRELVFDIDISDYDDVRKCCKKEDICIKCWPFMSIACQILDTALREDFGYEHILWVFSGRRGIHCWVSDKEARNLDNLARTSIVNYLHHVYNVDSINFRKKASQLFRRYGFHPSIQRAINIISKHFEDLCVKEQDILGTNEQIDKFLKYILDENIRKFLKDEFSKVELSTERWEIFTNKIQLEKQKGQLTYNMRNIIEEIQIYYCYPRLDINVSKGMNHLLKAPFCVHPKTGKICVPFHPKNVEKFNPNNVPNIDQLIDEIHIYDSKIDPEVPEFNISNPKDSRKTSLLKYLLVFEQFVSKLMRHNGELKTLESMEF